MTDIGAAPTGFYLAMATDTIDPTHGIDTFGELEEIRVGKDYPSGGFPLGSISSDWISGLNIPDEDTAKWLILLEDDPVISNRNVLAVIYIGELSLPEIYDLLREWPLFRGPLKAQLGKGRKD